ncbi:hypothetical protein QFZ43_004403 [Streptomyces afghaniensis]|nr:hypothetical protein [Streptomyces afghaniensis]
MNGQERGGARAVDRHARAAQAEHVGEPVRHQVEGPPGRRMRREGFRLSLEDADVGEVVGEHSGEHTGVASGQRFGPQPGIFQCFPGDFEEDPLLRVHLPCLAGGYAEEEGIERVDRVAEEPALRSDHLARRVRLGADQGFGAPAVGRHGTDRVGPGLQQPPEGVRVASAGEPAGKPDHRDRFAPRARFPALGADGAARCAARPRQHVGGQRMHGRVRPEVGDGQMPAQRLGKAGHQACALQRGEPVLSQWRALVDVAGGAPDKGSDLLTQPCRDTVERCEAVSRALGHQQHTPRAMRFPAQRKCTLSTDDSMEIPPYNH